MSDENYVTKQTEREWMTRGLVGAHYEYLYMTSAWFKTQVDAILAYLPTVIEGLAAIAEQKEQEFLKQLLVARQGWPTTLGGVS